MHLLFPQVGRSKFRDVGPSFTLVDHSLPSDVDTMAPPIVPTDVVLDVGLLWRVILDEDLPWHVVLDKDGASRERVFESIIK